MDPVASVLALFELRNRIFSYNGRADNARCARVCRNWLEVALDQTWSDLPCIGPLLAILSPLVLREGEGEDRMYLHFSRAPRPSDWERFFFYAIRVRTLTIGQTICTDEGGEGELHKDLLYELAMSRPAFCILPNLVNISIEEIYDNTDIFLSYLHLFLHETVKHLEFYLGNWDTQFSDSVLVQLSAKCLDLRSLRVCRRGRNEVHQTTQRLFQDFVKSQQNLEKLETFSSTISPDFFMSLGRMEKLHSISISDVDHLGEDNLDIPIPRRPEAILQNNLFPALRELNIPAFPVIIGPLFAQRDFHKLVRVVISGYSICDSYGFQVFLENLSRSCTGLEELTAYAYSNHSNRESLEQNPITASTLRYLPRFSNLHSLTIRLDKMIDISDTELAAIILGCGTLQKLIFNPRPHIKKETRFTLGLLGHLAAHTRLRHLELYVDARVDVTPSNAPIRLFQGLKGLNIAYSPISTAIHAAAYLSQVLPSSCEFVVSRPTVGIWDEVKTILSVLLPYKKADRSRFERLETEIKQLEATVDHLLQSLTGT